LLFLFLLNLVQIHPVAVGKESGGATGTKLPVVFYRLARTFFGVLIVLL
jgi:hypothetical protein